MSTPTIKDLDRRMKRACDALNRVLADTKRTHPDACLYLAANGSLNLMSGPHHGDHHEARHDLVLATHDIKADGGDW